MGSPFLAKILDELCIKPGFSFVRARKIGFNEHSIEAETQPVAQKYRRIKGLEVVHAPVYRS
jgi:hypothetical protein